MRLNVGIVLVGIVLFVGSSCNVVDNLGSRKKSETSKDTIVPQLSENKRIEYRYKYIEAVKLRLMGKTSQALEYLTQCSEIRPNAPDPYYQKSLIATQIEELQEAVRYGKKAVDHGPNNKWYRLNLANLYVRSEVIDSARMQYSYLVEEMNINELDILFKLAQLHQKTDNYQEALEYYDLIEGRIGVNERISQLKKMIYAKIGEKEKAYNEIKKLIEKYPDESSYYGMLAELYATFNDYEKAEKMYDRLFEVDSTNKLGHMSLVKYYNKKGHVEKALDVYKSKVIPNKSINFRDKMMIFMNFLQQPKKLTQHANRFESSLDSLDKHHPEKMEVDALYADLYLKTKEFRKAADYLQTLATSPESKYIYWDQLLSIYSYLGNFDKMFRYGQKALNTFDNKPRIYLLTGIGAMQTNHPDTAITLFQEGLKYIQDKKSMEVQFYTQLGEAYHQTENYQESDRYFKKVLELDPNNKLVLNNYSYYLSLRGEKLKKALGYSNRVIQDEPRNPIYLDTYAWILFRMGEYREAKKYIKKAIKNGGSDDADIVEHYGDILYKNGQKKKAIQIWEKAKKMGNHSEQLNYKITNKTLPPQSDEN
jgi:tetratricopeptide (TPR) repeat protein